MEKTIIFATGNEGKMREVRMILADTGFRVVSMKEAGIHCEIIENGETFEENALIKARTVCRASGAIAMADDSGLEIDALQKQPGVHSARFLGEDTPYDIKNSFILKKLEGLKKEDRTARFVCAIACVSPDGWEKVCRETMEGFIAEESRGTNGFGYDPIFWMDDFQCTNGELEPEQKNAVSHRGKALRRMRQMLEEETV